MCEYARGDEVTCSTHTLILIYAWATTHMMDAECVGDLVVPRAECSEPGDVGTGTMIGIPVQEVEFN